MRPINFNPYHAALAADEAFQQALIRAYGQSAAADARYRMKHEDAAVRAARDRKLAADARWREEVASARGGR